MVNIICCHIAEGFGLKIKPLLPVDKKILHISHSPKTMKIARNRDWDTLDIEYTSPFKLTRNNGVNWSVFNTVIFEEISENHDMIKNLAKLSKEITNIIVRPRCFLRLIRVPINF